MKQYINYSYAEFNAEKNKLNTLSQLLGYKMST